MQNQQVFDKETKGADKQDKPSVENTAAKKKRLQKNCAIKVRCDAAYIQIMMNILVFLMCENLKKSGKKTL